jgi:hypothetical protein
MDKVQKHNSFNTNTPSSESYRNYKTHANSMYPNRTSNLCLVWNNGDTATRQTLELGQLARVWAMN